MQRIKYQLFCFSLILLNVLFTGPLVSSVARQILTYPQESTKTHYHGMCEASAAVALDEKHFLVANDEDNVLRLFRTDDKRRPMTKYSLSQLFPSVINDNHKIDLEGGARIGDVIYWAGSHSANDRGEERRERQKIFAVKVSRSGEGFSLDKIGSPYTDLLKDIMRDNRLNRYHLDEAAKRRSDHEREALSIEGLAATRENKLLVGFRSPLKNNHALLLPILNPSEIMSEKHANFGEAIELDLDGLGIRDIAYWPQQDSYIIVAGRPGHNQGKKFRLFKWSGIAGDRPKLLHRLDNFNSEAAFTYPGLEAPPRIQLLSDDGSDCKKKSPKFRSMWITFRIND